MPELETSMDFNGSSNSSSVVNVEDWGWYVPEHMKLPIQIICGFIVIPGIIGNLCVIILVLFRRELHTQFYVCLASLAVCDCAVLVFAPILPLLETFSDDDSPLGEAFFQIGIVPFIIQKYTNQLQRYSIRGLCCNKWRLIIFGLLYSKLGLFLATGIDRGLPLSSLCHTLVVTTERFLAICKPLAFQTCIHSKRVTYVFLLVAWLLPISLGFATLTMNEYVIEVDDNNVTTKWCNFKDDEPWFLAYDTFLSCLYFAIVTAVLVLATIMVRQLNRVGSTMLGENSSDIAARKRLQNRRQAVNIIVVITILFIITVLPFQVFILVLLHNNNFLDGLTQTQRVVVDWTFRFAFYINHVGNPFIYSFVSEQFRKAFKQFCRCGKKPESTNALYQLSRT